MKSDRKILEKSSSRRNRTFFSHYLKSEIFKIRKKKVIRFYITDAQEREECTSTSLIKFLLFVVLMTVILSLQQQQGFIIVITRVLRAHWPRMIIERSMRKEEMSKRPLIPNEIKVLLPSTKKMLLLEIQKVLQTFFYDSKTGFQFFHFDWLSFFLLLFLLGCD